MYSILNKEHQVCFLTVHLYSWQFKWNKTGKVHYYCIKVSYSHRIAKNEWQKKLQRTPNKQFANPEIIADNQEEKGVSELKKGKYGPHSISTSQRSAVLKIEIRISGRLDPNYLYCILKIEWKNEWAIKSFIKSIVEEKWSSSLKSELTFINFFVIFSGGI